MRRLLLILGAIAVFTVSAAPAYSWTKAAAFGRTYEWAQYDWPHFEVQYPFECKGPYENGHGVTQWACRGVFEFAEEWQVNIDAYGVQTYHTVL